MDSIDDFEMKPITEGLGFHKKATRLDEQVKKAELYADQERRVPAPPPAGLLDSSLPSFSMPRRDFIEREQRPAEKKRPEVKVTEPLPRPPMQTLRQDRPSPPTQLDKAGLDKSVSVGTRRSGHGAPEPGRLVAVPVSLAALFLDALVVIGLGMFFLLSLIVVTGVDLMSVFVSARADFSTQISVGLLYFAVVEIYVITSRSLYGSTLGEWTFDLQLGDDRQQKETLYPLLVVWRTVVNLVTGFVVLPLLSFLIRKDLASYLTGLQLYRRRRA